MDYSHLSQLLIQINKTQIIFENCAFRK